MPVPTKPSAISVITSENSYRPILACKYMPNDEALDRDIFSAGDDFEESTAWPFFSSSFAEYPTFSPDE
jgi:hypothetical protein